MVGRYYGVTLAARVSIFQYEIFTELYSHNSNEYRTQTSWKNGGILRIKNFPNSLEPHDI